MKTNRMGDSRAPRAAAEPRRRPTDSVFRNFVRTLEKLESARGGARPAKGGLAMSTVCHLSAVIAGQAAQRRRAGTHASAPPRAGDGSRLFASLRPG